MAREKTKAGAPEPPLEAAEYVLGLLNHSARQDFARRLRDDASLRAAVVYWENRLAPLSDDAAPVAPPESVRRALDERLFADATQPKPGLWQSLSFWRGLSFAALAAAVVLGGAAYMQLDPPRQAAGTLIASLAGESDAVRLAVAYDAADGTLRLNRVAGAAAAGRAFELWLIEGANAPVSLGVLPAAAQGTITVPEALRAKLPNAILAVSDEPQGGSPTGQPTGAVLATGQVLTVS